MLWVVFKNKTGEEICSYTLEGTFAGEMDETKKLLAYDKGISLDDITTEIQDRKQNTIIKWLFDD